MTSEAKTTQPKNINEQLTAGLLRDKTGNIYITRALTETQVVTIFEYFENFPPAQKITIYIDSRLPQSTLDRIRTKIAAKTSSSVFTRIEKDLGESITLKKYPHMPNINRLSFSELPEDCQTWLYSTNENNFLETRFTPAPLLQALRSSISLTTKENIALTPPSKPQLPTSSSNIESSVSPSETKADALDSSDFATPTQLKTIKTKPHSNHITFKPLPEHEGTSFSDITAVLTAAQTTKVANEAKRHATTSSPTNPVPPSDLSNSSSPSTPAQTEATSSLVANTQKVRMKLVQARSPVAGKMAQGAELNAMEKDIMDTMGGLMNLDGFGIDDDLLLSLGPMSN